MTVLAVDLAAKLSAACLMNEDYKVLHEVDSWGCSEDTFLWEITRFWDPKHYYPNDKRPEVMVVEDLPHGLKYSSLIKDVCRLQGRIYDQMNAHWDPSRERDDAHCGDYMLFLAPAEWRRRYDGMGRGTGPEIVTEVAARYGYAPPMDDLIRRSKGNGGMTRARKVATDYCSAYLIARWAIFTKKVHGTYDIVGTSRYRTRAITKKDINAENN